MNNGFFDQVKVLLASVAIGALLAQPSQAAICKTSATGMLDYTQYPLFQNTNVPPVSMLALSIDHQLFNKAYTDYTNLDNDPEVEITYDGAVTYSGYFGSDICYSYGGGVYSASGPATNKKCAGQWSGNFLNWVTMTRLDILRWVLYGGNRSTDTATQTILERAHIPQDGHSYVKIFETNPQVSVSEVTPYTEAVISICNTTSTNEESSTTTSPPVMQIARGRHPAWTLIERFQCDFGRGGGSPPAATQIAINTVRVQVCSGATQEDFCRSYPNGGTPVSKPAGLMQEYGEVANGIEFGLVSGSYDRPRAGGMLRSNVGKISTEINLTNGQFINQTDGTPGVINTIRRIRSSQYRRDFWRDCGNPGISNNQLTDTRGTRKCNMWGNPISEIYAEALRYLGNEGATPAFAANDGTPTGADPAYIPGMPAATWVDPFVNRPRCTACSIIVLSTGLNSFDRDQIPPVAVLGGVSIDTAVDTVGTNESITGNVLIGAVLAGATDTPAAANASARACSAKVGTMSQLSGICPEVGSLHGGYGIAGLAHRAYINDLRPTLEGRQLVRTYTLALGESLPSFDIPVAGQRITVLPFAQSTNNAADPNTWKSSSIVNFQTGFLVGPRTAADVGTCTTAPTPAACNYFGVPTGNTATLGSYIINWEDSTWGNDYDQDGVQVLSYCVGASCLSSFCDNADVVVSPMCAAPITFAPDTLYVRSEVVATAGSFALRFGFITAGSNAPGTTIATIANGSSSNNFLTSPTTDFTNANRWTRPRVIALTPSNTGARLLENPLFYAAKYGNFEDLDDPGNDLPDTNAGINNNPEWDNINLQGENTPDGLPDAYFPVRNPNLLKEQLGRVFARVAATQASGTSAAVVSSSGGGNGAVFQASYAEEAVDQTDPSRKVKWIGSLRGLWVTEFGELAEDTNQNGVYDSGSDLVVTFGYDRDQRRTFITRGGANLDLSELAPIWDAGTVLSKMDSTELVTNRSYSGELAQNKRFITTWVDQNKNGRVEIGEQRPFVADTDLTNLYSGYLNTCSVADANRVVNWVRGIDQPAVPASVSPPQPAQAAMRSRQINLDAIGAIETARLGDIVNSSPLVIANPNQTIDFVYRDASYTQFASQYRCRRTVVYAGANDGMLHAFNGGFRTDNGFDLSPATGCTTGGASHALGSELWGYVPGNLLPHLPWMTDEDYTHVFYVDGSPQSYDVKAFTPSITHPAGWGTILIVPFRMGGGPISVRTSALLTRDHIARPAFVILDVTDPEQPPTLLAEVVLPNNGTVTTPGGTANQRASFSFGAPALAFDLSFVGTNSNYDYRLYVGSGPTTFNPEIYSEQNANVFSYDLKALIAQAGTPTRTVLAQANSFTSDMNSADFDFGGTTDAIYFGTIRGTPATTGPDTDVNAAMGGDLYKIPTEAAGPTVSGGPPQPGRQFGFGSPSVFFTDNRPIQSQPALTVTTRRVPGIAFGTGRMLSKGDFGSNVSNSLYILDDPSPFSTAAFSGTLGTDAVEYRTQNATRGLRIPLAQPERSFTSPVVFRGIGVFTTFRPEADQCFALGESGLFQVNFANATADAILGSTGISRTNLGDGAASNPRIIVSTTPLPPLTPGGPTRPPRIGILVQDSTGRLNTADSIENLLNPFAEQSWFEPREN